mgnify:CR=1 FL=1
MHIWARVSFACTTYVPHAQHMCLQAGAHIGSLLCVPTRVYLTWGCHNFGWMMDWLDVLCRHFKARWTSHNKQQPLSGQLISVIASDEG